MFSSIVADRGEEYRVGDPGYALVVWDEVSGAFQSMVGIAAMPRWCGWASPAAQMMAMGHTHVVVVLIMLVYTGTMCGARASRLVDTRVLVAKPPEQDGERGEEHEKVACSAQSVRQDIGSDMCHSWPM